MLHAASTTIAVASVIRIGVNIVRYRISLLGEYDAAMTTAPPPQPAGPAKGSLLYDVFVLSRTVGELLTDGLADAPLAANEYAVYSFVLENDRATPTEMRNALGMPMQTASDWVALLRRRGHATTVPNPDDGRSFLISLTEDGRRAHRETRWYFNRTNEAFLKRLATPEVEMREHLTEIIAAADAAWKDNVADTGTAPG